MMTIPIENETHVLMKTSDAFDDEVLDDGSHDTDDKKLLGQHPLIEGIFLQEDDLSKKEGSTLP